MANTLLRAPGSAQPQEFRTIAGLTTLGLVVNPKTNKPVLATTDGEYVSIRSLERADFLRRLGRGYLESGGDPAANATRLPRVHTPDGVVVKRMGYGTSLYTAICLGAALTVQEAASLSSGIEGEGISSDPENRSHEASVWWAASHRQGLTQLYEDQIEQEETDENVDIDVEPDELSNCVSVDGDIVYVNRVNVDIRRDTTVDVEFNFYTYESAREHNLIPAELVVELPDMNNLQRGTDMRYVWEALMREYEKADFYDLDADALLALDVRGLDADAINLLQFLYMQADLDTDGLRYRWQYNLDPSAAPPEQLRLPLKANPAVAESLGEVLDEVAEARADVGWGDLDLP